MLEAMTHALQAIARRRATGDPNVQIIGVHPEHVPDPVPGSGHRTQVIIRSSLE
jgi:hypothetical protein